ncbi:titin [Drosophila serrata]|uniref:titin n=1 Tax=Drosophila serrata TaxID=7274 RepID=UPI000A1CF3FE|nr:titin [Drosophila serrata]
MEQLRVGDPCQECLSQGRDHKLRLFYLNLAEETLLKCEARTCLWPHNDEVSSDEEVEFETSDSITPLQSMPPVTPDSLPSAPPPSMPQKSLPSLLENLPADTPINATWEKSRIPFEDPVAVDDDEFIRQLLQQLTPVTESDSDESAREPKLNLDSLPDLETPVEEVVKVKPSLEPQLPDFSCLDLKISEQISKPQKATIAKAEIPLIPVTLLLSPKLKAQGRQINPKAKSPAPKIQHPAKQEYETQPAKPMNPTSPKGDPFISPPQKASTQPRSPSAADAQPAFNIIISIPEINPTKSFMDAVSRHSAAGKPVARGGGRNTPRPAMGRRPRAQAVMQMIEQMETTADAKRTS